MTKKMSEAVLVAKSEAAARRKCVKSLVAWSAKPVSMESLEDDHPDGFHLHDVEGSGSFEALAGRLEQNLAPAPCGQCPKCECPGSLEGCLLEMDLGELQDQLDLASGEAEASPFVVAAMKAGLSYDEAIRKEVEMEIEMNRLASEMDSIH
ncbi:MAG: hypothetical protein WC724_02950 [Candidatus Paceibacterota bacterium]|jgi:hypothetical protein